MKCVVFVLVISALLSSYFAEKHEIRGRIFNGHDARPDQFKFIVAVRARLAIPGARAKFGLCGGSLIARNWVLTAAHCLHGRDMAKIYLGAIVRDDAEVTYIVWSHCFIPHPQFRMNSFSHDVALIPIPKTEECARIKYVPLPHLGTKIFTHDAAITMGWGLIGDRGVSPNHLQWTTVQVMNNQECNKTYGDIADTDVCVRTTSPRYGSHCLGDSGGPLLSADTGVLIGVASRMSVKGCEAGIPTVYMRLSSYMPWISAVTGIQY